MIIGKFLTSLVLAATLVAPIPFKSVQELQAKGAAVVAQQDGACGPGTVGVLVGAEDKSVKYNLYLVVQFVGTPNEKTSFILIDASDGDNTPVWVGVIDKDGNLVVKENLTYSELKVKYPQVCSVIRPQA